MTVGYANNLSMVMYVYGTKYDTCSVPSSFKKQNRAAHASNRTQSHLLEEKVRELSDCHDQLEVAREAEEEYERRLDDEQAKTRRKIQALEVGYRDAY